jgi:hypothetical protein
MKDLIELEDFNSKLSIDIKFFILNLIYFILNYKFKKYINFVQFGDWGLGIGDWGLGIGPNPQSPKSPIPNPQSPIPIQFYN